ncbi:hypothetical protein P8452_52213 [Trifolium repens]|nr:hypothetical protein P8452_52213 [Trifolium repens]
MIGLSLFRLSPDFLRPSLPTATVTNAEVVETNFQPRPKRNIVQPKKLDGFVVPPVKKGVAVKTAGCWSQGASEVFGSTQRFRDGRR